MVPCLNLFTGPLKALEILNGKTQRDAQPSLCQRLSCDTATSEFLLVVSCGIRGQAHAFER